MFNKLHTFLHKLTGLVFVIKVAIRKFDRQAIWDDYSQLGNNVKTQVELA